MKNNPNTIATNGIGMVICPICYTMTPRCVLNRNDNVCEFCKEVIDGVIIDEMIAPTIVILNQKGYNTHTCCAGHIYDPCGYIAFDNHDIEEFANIFVSEMSDVFKFKLSKDTKFRIGWSLDGSDVNIMRLMEALFNINKMLYNWANRIPYNPKLYE